MYKQDPNITHRAKEDPIPQWVPPPPPVPGFREWMSMILHRFGFAASLVFTVALLVILYLNADLLLNEPTRENPSIQTAVRESGPSTSPGARESSLHISVTTEPSDALVLLDGDSVGTSPLQNFSVSRGLYQITVEKDDFVTVDTFVVVRDQPSSYSFSLKSSSGTRPTPRRFTPPMSPSPQSHEAPVGGTDNPPVVEDNTSSEESTIVAIPPPQDESGQASESVESELDESVSEEPMSAVVLDSSEVISMGTLVLSSSPRGAAVFLDDIEAGKTPLLLEDVPPGDKVVSFELEGHSSYSEAVQVHGNQSTAIQAELIPQQGTLKILARPWGSIYIDGTLHKSETSVWYTINLPVGNHRVRVEHPALGQWEQIIEVGAVEEKVVEVNFNE